MKKFEQGTPVTVRYTPSNPDKAVLIARGSYLIPIVILVLIMIGAGLQFGFLDKIPFLRQLLQQ